jgi:hypothetical protein
MHVCGKAGGKPPHQSIELVSGGVRLQPLRFGFLPLCAPMTEAVILARAAEIRRPGRYIGLFEWAVWSHAQQAAVLILFGERIVNLRDLLGLPALSGNRPTHFIAGVRLSASGHCFAAVEASQVNHWVIGRPVHTGTIEMTASSSTSSSSAGDVTARAAALRSRWMLGETNRTGDCGPDAMCFWGRKSRSATGWKDVRSMLASEMEGLRAVPLWQEVFSSCGEAVAPHAPPPLPAPPVQPLSSDGGQKISDAIAALPPAAATTSPSDGGDPVAPVAPASFLDWVKGLDHDRRNLVMRDYFSFKEAEEQWRVANPKPKAARRKLPAQQRQATKFSYKLEVGKQYLEWLETVGSGSSSPLKVLCDFGGRYGT